MPSRLTITVRHPADKDRNGDDIDGTKPPDDLLKDCLVAPRPSTEDEDLAVYSGLVIYAPAGSTVDPTDALVIPGYDGEWQVSGDPGRWDLSGASGHAGVVIPVRKVT